MWTNEWTDGPTNGPMNQTTERPYRAVLRAPLPALRLGPRQPRLGRIVEVGRPSIHSFIHSTPHGVKAPRQLDRPTLFRSPSQPPMADRVKHARLVPRSRARFFFSPFFKVERMNE